MKKQFNNTENNDPILRPIDSIEPLRGGYHHDLSSIQEGVKKLVILLSKLRNTNTHEVQSYHA